MKRAVVLIPGIMGSVLRLGKDPVWPGDVASLHGGFRRFELLLRDDLVADDVLRRLFGTPMYQALIDELAEWGFHEGGPAPTLVTCPYDWRRSIELAAGVLADVLDRVSAAHQGRAQISLVAHSMGGLVARHYLESRRFRKRRAYSRIRLLAAIGSPHRGCPLALAAIQGRERRLFLNRHQVRELAGDPRFPSVYQLLPPREEPFAWDSGTSAPVNLYSKDTAAALGLSAAGLRAARSLHESLDVRRRPGHVRYVFFYGTRHATPALTNLARSAGALTAENVDIEGGGDGTVPAWSAAWTGIQGRPVGGEHDVLYRAAGVRRTLASLLGARMPDPERPEVEVTVRNRVVDPGQRIRASVAFASPRGLLSGQLKIQRVRVNRRGTRARLEAASTPRLLRYAGVRTDAIGLHLEAPAEPGVYRVSFRAEGDEGEDYFFVQARAP